MPSTTGSKVLSAAAGALLLTLAACGSTDPATPDGGGPGPDGASDAAVPDGGADSAPPDASPPVDGDPGPDTLTGDASVPVDATTDGGGGDVAAGGSWEALEPLAAPRQETAVVELGGLIYLIGGFDATGTVVPTVEAYDPVNDSWEARQDLPAALHHANAAVVDGKLYVLGSLRELSFTANADSFVYDPEDDQWSPVTSMTAGRQRGSGVAAAIGSIIYVAGGYRQGAREEFDAYDTVNDRWDQMPAMPGPRDHLVGATVDGIFYAIGGRASTITDHSPRVEAFDPGTGLWTDRTPMPTSRGGAAAGVVNGLILVVGGEGNPNNPDTGVFAEAEAYDPATDTWITLPPMRTPRHGTGAAGLDGRLYVPGGASRQAFGAVDTVEVYVLP